MLSLGRCCLFWPIRISASGLSCNNVELTGFRITRDNTRREGSLMCTHGTLM